MPISDVPWKNSTRLMLPLQADAFAVIVTFAVAVKLVPLVGVVTLAVGGEPTVILIGFEVVLGSDRSCYTDFFARRIRVP